MPAFNQLRRSLLRASLMACLPGCMSVDDDDAELAADCARQGEFSVELGEGEDGFVALGPDAAPALVLGAQGGAHLILAARLRTPDPLDRYAVSLLAELGQAPCSNGECAQWTRSGGFDAQLDSSSEQITQTDESSVEISRLFLVVENWPAAPLRRLTLAVSDVCGRSASTMRTFE